MCAGISDKNQDLFTEDKVLANNFEEHPPTYTLKCRVRADGIGGLSGVNINIKGGNVNQTVMTDAHGGYLFTGLFNETYTLTLSMAGYTVSPSSLDITINGSDTSAPVITATQQGDGGDPHEIHGIIFVTIPDGTFRMSDIQGGGYRDEQPVHNVTLDGFEMSAYEVTNAQYIQYLTEALAFGDITATSSSVTGAKGEYSEQEYLNLDVSKLDISYSDGTFTVKDGRDNHPVTEVTWYGAKAFALHYGCDLPTEAEWEYACRAGTEVNFYTGNDFTNDFKPTSNSLQDAGWYENNSRNWGVTPLSVKDLRHPVGQKIPNAWGLYDMHGNVNEWCHDWYDEDYYSKSPPSNPTGPQTGSKRVSRGGDYDSYAILCRSSDRGGSKPDGSGFHVGFRVVRRPGGVTY